MFVLLIAGKCPLGISHKTNLHTFHKTRNTYTRFQSFHCTTLGAPRIGRERELASMYHNNTFSSSTSACLNRRLWDGGNRRPCESLGQVTQARSRKRRDLIELNGQRSLSKDELQGLKDQRGDDGRLNPPYLSGPLNWLNATLCLQYLLDRDSFCNRKRNCEALSRPIPHPRAGRVLNCLALYHLGVSM